MSDLRLATHEEGSTILIEANTWYSKVGGIWCSAKTSALSAVAEYIANQRGLTLYNERVK